MLAAIIQSTAEHWDIALAIGLAVLGGSMSLVSWFFKKRMEAYDKHLEECRHRAVVQGRMDERLIGMEVQAKGIQTNVQWVGDCMVTVGAKLAVKLPDRPS